MRVKWILTLATAAFLLVIGGGLAQQGGQQQGGGRGQTGGQQVQQQAQQPGIVTGQVVSATTNEPLRKVSVVLQPQGGRGGGRAAATSDNGGMFRFESVEPGQYTLSGDRTGFVRAVYGEDQPGGDARRIEVTSGQTTSGIQLKLIPHSVVVGRVFDEDGDPLENAQVQISRYTYQRGQRQLSVVQNGSTNDLGEFRISGLAPGRYFASAVGRGGPSGGGRGRGGFFGNQDDNEVEEGYITTYYPRTASPSGATPMDLVPGSELRGIDIGLLKERFYDITGVIEGAPSLAETLAPVAQQIEAVQQLIQQQFKGAQGKAKQKAKQKGQALEDFANQINVQVRLLPRELPGGVRPAANLSQGRVNQQGQFTIQNVPPGAYYVMAQTRPIGGQQVMTARIPVDVTSGDLQNVRLRLQPPVAVTGTIAPEREDPNLKLNQVQVNFAPAVQGLPGLGGRGGAGRLEIAENGTFQTQLAADIYTVELGNPPQGYYLKAVKASGREVPEARLDLSYPVGPVDVVLANDSGSITGTVQNGNEPAAAARVTIVPASGTTRRDFYKAANSADDGTFTISGLPPGPYKMFAWAEMEGTAWMDAEFRQPFETLAASIEVRPASSATATLRVIGREQLAAAGIR